MTKSHEAYGEVVTEGQITAGSIFFNMCPEFVEGPKHDVNVFQMNDIDHDKYIDMLAKSIGL